MKKQFDEMVFVIFNKDDLFPVMEEYTSGKQAKIRLDELRKTHDVVEINDKLLQDRKNSVTIVLEEKE